MATAKTAIIGNLKRDLAWERRMLRLVKDDVRFWGASKARLAAVADWQRTVRATEKRLARARARRAAK